MARSSLKNIGRLIDAAKQVLPPEQAFLHDLKRSMEMTADKDSRPPSRTYKPSSMNCIRQSFYQITGKETDAGSSNYTTIGICNSGTDIHVRVQTSIEQMRENNMDCDYINVAEFVRQRNLDYLEIKSKSGMETKLYCKDLNMSFMCDGIIRYKNHYYILEIKTESSYKFVNRKDVDPAHHNQAIAYATAFGLNEVLFLYVSRDVLDMKTFIYNVTDEMKEGLVAYIEECDGYIKRMIVPPKPETIARKTCQYCSYKTICKADK